MLDICRKLFSEFNSHNILYCHFKSNEHLDAGLNGDTDLDILIGKKQYMECEKIFADIGYKQFEPIEFGCYPGVSNWFGFDEKTGKLVHIHFHTQLITGKTLVKEYVLPWDDFVLNSAIMTPEGVKVNKPSIELILLFTRMVVKRDIRNQIKSLRTDVFFEKDVWDEIRYLRRRVNKIEISEDFLAMYHEVINSGFLEMFLCADSIDRKIFSKFERYIRKALTMNCRMSRCRAYMQSFFKRIERRKNIISFHLFHNDVNVKKRPADKNGAIIAFVGIDGSGKSTMIGEIYKWLGSEFDVKKCYFGAGDGQKSIFVQIPIMLYQKMKKKQLADKKKSFDNKKEYKTIDTSIAKSIGASYTYAKLASDNEKKLRAAEQYCRNGGIVICDRFPQNVIEGIHDGMRVQRYSRKTNLVFIKKMAHWEKTSFRLIGEKKIDIIIKLIVDPLVAFERKKEDEIDPFERIEKAKTLKELKYKNPMETIEINANESYESVLLEIKKHIWDVL